MDVRFVFMTTYTVVRGGSRHHRSPLWVRFVLPFQRIVVAPAGSLGSTSARFLLPEGAVAVADTTSQEGFSRDLLPRAASAVSQLGKTQQDQTIIFGSVDAS